MCSIRLSHKDYSDCRAANKRIKRIHLTEEGERYRERMIAPLRQAEVRAMPTLEPAERRAMITYVDRFMNALEQQIDGIDA